MTAAKESEVERMMRSMIATRIFYHTHPTPVKRIVLDCVRDASDEEIVELVKAKELPKLCYGEMWVFNTLLEDHATWWPVLAAHLAKFVDRASMGNSLGAADFDRRVAHNDWTARDSAPIDMREMARIFMHESNLRNMRQ